MRARPKSPILSTRSSVLTNKLAGLRSRCSTLAEWIYLRPLRSWYMKSLAWPSDRRPLSSSWQRSVSMYSCTMYTELTSVRDTTSSVSQRPFGPNVSNTCSRKQSEKKGNKFTHFLNPTNKTKQQVINRARYIPWQCYHGRGVWWSWFLAGRVSHSAGRSRLFSSQPHAYHSLCRLQRTPGRSPRNQVASSPCSENPGQNRGCSSGTQTSLPWLVFTPHYQSNNICLVKSNVSPNKRGICQPLYYYPCIGTYPPPRFNCQTQDSNVKSNSLSILSNEEKCKH